MSVNWTKPLALVTVFFMLFTMEAFAGKGYHQSSGGKKKPGFFCKIGKAIKKVSQNTAQAIKTGVKKTGTAIKNVAVKTGKAIRVTGAKINNAVKDSGVWAKQKLTGKKNRLWVVGHYDKNGKWTKGHWRKFEAKPVNNPGQSGNHPGQGGNFPGQANNPGQGSNPGQTSDPLPPVGGDESDNGDAVDNGQTPAPAPDAGAPADGGEADTGDDAADSGDDGSESGDSSEADPTTPAPAPAPVPEDPVLPELPEDGEPGNAGSDEPEAEEPETPEVPESGDATDDAQAPEEPSDESEQSGQTGQSDDSEESGQAAQQSGDAAQGSKMMADENISLRTMGSLLNELAKQSDDLTSFKRSNKPGMSYSVDYSNDINAAYELREKNARLLVKVIVWDLQQNEGKSGKYFSYFKFKMRDFDARTRKMISDVTRRVKEGVKHGAGHQTSNSGKVLYQRRLKELEGF